jgi:membrane-bound metal-dependent hydrolase YbcI (DUF457 family)
MEKGVAVAAFRQHMMVSTTLGASYSGALIYVGGDWGHSLLAGSLCGLAGMLPDLDSDSGRPVQETFGLLAAVVPVMLLRRLSKLGINPESMTLIFVGMYVFIRFGLSWIFKHLTVHRGMFHSLPAAAIAAELVYLGDESHGLWPSLVLAGGVFLGFLSHLLLDEIYSFERRGLTIKVKGSAGTAFKLASDSLPATLTCWFLLGILTYLIGVREGLIEPIRLPLDRLVAFRYSP